MQEEQVHSFKPIRMVCILIQMEEFRRKHVPRKEGLANPPIGVPEVCPMDSRDASESLVSI